MVSTLLYTIYAKMPYTVSRIVTTIDSNNTEPVTLTRDVSRGVLIVPGLG